MSYISNERHTYGYNAIGNLISYPANGVSVSLSYGQSAGPHALTSYNGSTLTYDSNGNLVQDSQFYYEYSDANMLKKVRQGGSTGTIIEEYAYDADGSRIVKKTYGVVSTTTYYLGSHYEIIQYGNGTVTNTSYYFANGERIAQKDNTGVMYYHPDHLQSSTVMTNSSGSKIDEIRYYPYGQIESGGNSTKYGYNSKELDISTGLDYYGARYYNPATMHWTQPDTIIQNPYDPQMLNRYAYTRNNPIKYTDPSGHFIPALLAGGVVIAIPIAVTAVSVVSVGALTGMVMYASDANFDTSKMTTEGVANAAVSGMEYAKDVAVTTCVTVEAGLIGEFALPGRLGQLIGKITGASDITASTGASTVKTLGEFGSKADALNFVRSGENGLNEGAQTAANRFFKGATGESNSFRVQQAGQDFKFIYETAGKDPGAKVVYEEIIDSTGTTKSVMQYGYDTKGNLVHIDDKLNNKVIK